MNTDTNKPTSKKKPKLLYILNTAAKVNNFSYTSMCAARALDFEFHIAGNWSYTSDESRHADEVKYGIKIHQIDFLRSPYHPQNRKAYAQIMELMQKESFDAVHCNTPIGGIIGRIAAKRCKVKCVLYQAHGFHFYKGAPLKNWMIFYPVERWLARYTDTVITINKEDYALAKKKFYTRGDRGIYYVPGVGIDCQAYAPAPNIRASKRAELGFSDERFYLVSAGRLEENKNNEVLIRAIAYCRSQRPVLVLCGEGPQKDELAQLAQRLGVKERVFFLGNRADMREIYCASDAFAMGSFREGLSRTVMEAMATGLPCVISKIRGNTDLIEDGKGGFLYKPTDAAGFAKGFDTLAENAALVSELSAWNLKHVKNFDVSVATNAMREIYFKVIG